MHEIAVTHTNEAHSLKMADNDEVGVKFVYRYVATPPSHSSLQLPPPSHTLVLSQAGYRSTFKQSLDFHQKDLAIRTALLGREHPDTSERAGLLLDRLREGGKWDKGCSHAAAELAKAIAVLDGEEEAIQSKSELAAQMAGRL
jgi:hypothetical protein